MNPAYQIKIELMKHLAIDADKLSFKIASQLYSAVIKAKKKQIRKFPKRGNPWNGLGEFDN